MFAEIGCEVIPTPSLIAETAPAIVVCSRTADVHCSGRLNTRSPQIRTTQLTEIVDRRRTTKNLSPRHGVGLVPCRFLVSPINLHLPVRLPTPQQDKIHLWGARHAPIVLLASDQSRIQARSRDCRIVHAVGTGFEHSDFDVRVLGQARRDAEARLYRVSIVRNDLNCEEGSLTVPPPTIT